jgi:hypothetical protein
LNWTLSKYKSDALLLEPTWLVYFVLDVNGLLPDSWPLYYVGNLIELNVELKKEVI